MGHDLKLMDMGSCLKSERIFTDAYADKFMEIDGVQGHTYGSWRIRSHTDMLQQACKI